MNAEDLNLGLSHEAKLVWVDVVSQKHGHPANSGTPANGEDIWSLDGVSTPDKISGFAIRLLNYDGKPLATIPTTADRLVAARAKLAKGVALEEVHP